MVQRAVFAASAPRADVSPGLLHRRYSVPETVMRKYRLAQASSDTEERSTPPWSSLASCGEPGPRCPRDERAAAGVLHVAVSETRESAPRHHCAPDTADTADTRPARAADTTTVILDLDQYVSDILVESLSSLTDRIESVNDSMCYEGRVSVVEKEIRVRVQSTGVNTVLHLSPTSNNAIIFGNEELCDRAPDVNRAVLRQIQQLFDEGRRTASPPASLEDSLDEPSPRPPPLPPPPPPPPASFFIRLEGEGAVEGEGSEAGGPRLPDRLRARLQRRERRRELRLQSARRRRAEPRPASPAATAAALFDSLVDELITKIINDEYKCMRIKAADGAAVRVAEPPHRCSPPSAGPGSARGGAPRVRGRLALHASPPAPHRRYHKSELLEGARRVEILEIVEYGNTSHSGSDTADSDDTLGRLIARRSRIPVPIAARGGAPCAPPPSPPPRYRRVFPVIPEEPPAAPRRSVATSPLPQPRAAEFDDISRCNILNRTEDRKSASTQCEPAPPTAGAPAAGDQAGAAGGGVDADTALDDRPRNNRNSRRETKKLDTRTVKTERVKLDVKTKLKKKKPRENSSTRSVSEPSVERGGAGGDSSSSCEGLLCPGAPRWLAARRRRARAAHRAPPPAPPAPPAPAGWSVTLCGGARTALPRDVEMRLRFPSPPAQRPAHCDNTHVQWSPQRAGGATVALHDRSTDSSIFASRSRKKSTDTLPEVETYRASRSHTKRCVKAVVTDTRLLPTLLAAPPAAARRLHKS